MRKWMMSLLLTLLALPASAEQQKPLKILKCTIRRSTQPFNPKVASSYQLTRNGYTAILNISVLDRASLGKPATEAKLTGHAKNLIGNLRELSFKQVKEGNAIYYLAEVPISNEEMLTFDIDVDAGLKGAGKLTFSQKFYTEQ